MCVAVEGEPFSVVGTADPFNGKLPESAPYGGLGLCLEETVEVASHGATKTNTDIDI